MKYDFGELMIMTDGLTLLSYKEDSKDKVMKWLDIHVTGKNCKFEVIRMNVDEILSTSSTIDSLLSSVNRFIETNVEIMIKYLALSFRPVIVVDYENSAELMQKFIETDDGKKLSDEKLRHVTKMVNDELLSKLIDMQDYMEEYGATVILLNPIQYVTEDIYIACIFELGENADAIRNMIKFDMNKNPGYIEYVKHKNFKDGVCISEEI